MQIRKIPEYRCLSTTVEYNLFCFLHKVLPMGLCVNGMHQAGVLSAKNILHFMYPALLPRPDKLCQAPALASYKILAIGSLHWTTWFIILLRPGLFGEKPSSRFER